MRYVLGYFALMLAMSGLSLIAAGEVLGFFLILVAAALVYLIIRLERERRRARKFGGYADAIEGYERRFAAAVESLQRKLPEDALDNPAVLELLSAYEQESSDEADEIRSEYARLRQLFLDWQKDFEHLHAENEAGTIGLPARFVEHSDQLDQRLTELFAEVERLEARAAAIGKAADDPLDEIARAALALEDAKAACRRAFGEALPAELESELTAGDEKLEQAREALAKDAERPLVASRLARQICDLAASVTRRAEDLAKLPAELGAARGEVEGSSARVEQDIANAKAKLAAAAELYAPSCLLEIRGFGAAAEQALERARALVSEPRGSANEGLHLVAAKEALTRAADLAKRIDDHLQSLERAASDARHNVEHAEREVDRAWTNVTAGSTSPDDLQRAERVAARGRELAADARKEIEQPRPDWFRAIALANRAVDVVRELPLRASEHEDAAASTGGGGPNVEHARLRAEAALAAARNFLTTSDDPLTGMDNMTSLFLERGEYAYEKAVALQKQLADADDPDAIAHAAMDGFRLAEDAAAAVQEHALGLRLIDGSKRSGGVTAKVVWGSLGAAAAAAFFSD